MKTKDIKITVSGQTLAADTAAMMSASRNLYRLVFEFREKIDAAVYVLLEKEGVASVYLPTEEDAVTVPNEFCESEGVLKVSVFADDLMTTNAVGIPVIRSAYDAAVLPSGADGSDSTKKCVFTPTDETAVTIIKKDAEGFKAYCGGEYIRVGSKNDYTDADKTLVGLIPSKADEADLEDCIESVGSLLRDKVDKIDGKGLSTNDFTDADRDSVRATLPNSVSELCGKVEAVQSDKVDKIDGKGLSSNDYTDEEKDFLNETIPKTFDATSAKISEIEVNVYNNYKNKVDKVVGKGLSSNDYTDAEKAEVAKVGQKLNDPGTNGIVIRYMADVTGTLTLDKTMPTAPTDGGVPTTKLLREMTKNPLGLSDTDLQKTGILAQSYTAAGSTPGTVGTQSYSVRQTENVLSEGVSGALKIPTSYAVYKYVESKASAVTPSINGDGNWVIGTTDTGISAKGTKGDKGDKGDKGESGKTPVKGTDYFTEADKTELVNAVLAALPNGNGVKY